MCPTQGSLKQKQVCHALRCSGLHARYTDAFNEFVTLLEKGWVICTGSVGLGLGLGLGLCGSLSLRDHDGHRSARPSSHAHGSTHRTETQATCFSPVLLFLCVAPIRGACC